MKPVCTLLTTGTNGAKVRVTSDPTISANAMVIQPYTGAGACYVGNADLDPSTGAGLIAIMPYPDAVFTFPQSQNGANQISPYNFYVAGTNTGDKVLVTWFIA